MPNPPANQWAKAFAPRLPKDQKGVPSEEDLNSELANTKAALTGFTGIGDEPSVMYPEARDTYNKAELASILSQLVGLHPSKAAIAPVAEALTPALRALPEGMSIRELGSSALDRDALDEILKPWLQVGSKVHPDDRAIFNDMRSALENYPNIRTRVLLSPEEQPIGAYQLVNRGLSRYMPNLGVSEQGKGIGTSLLGHAKATREAPTSLYSAPGKEGFYRKQGLKESNEDGISKFSFAQGGVVNPNKIETVEQLRAIIRAIQLGS